jgi:quercetin dioxygenase-like cupin family protein
LSQEVIHRSPDEGTTLLIGHDGDYVTGKATSDETGGRYTVYEVLSTPGFGPPLHTHSWQEFFYVLEGEFTFSCVVDGEVREIAAGPRTSFTIPPHAPHGFRNSSDGYSRMLVIDEPVGIEPFFRDVGVAVDRPGASSEQEAFDPRQMGEVLPRFGVHIVGAPVA